ncbi:TolC family protein [Fibrella aquatica]|uniref:TolC family protein n=1 Tax=Fibrella aquatica TaxID=3242487 RepID=UPI0035224FF4
MRFLLLVLLTYLPLSVLAQDSLHLNRQQADSLFLRNNLLLLAERFRINAGQAQIIQASLIDNPTVSVELSSFNNQTRRVLDVGRQGQKTFAVQQLLYTAGKRNKRIALAAEAAQLTQYELLDLLRSLRFELRSRFYAVFFQQQTIARFDQQITILQTTIDAYEKEYNRNNVSLRELVRLKALLFQIENDRTEILLQVTDDQRTLRTLLGIEQPVFPIVRGDALIRYVLPTLTDDTLRAIALRARPDLLATQSLSRQAELNLNLQRALARPDIRVGAAYDQAGSYIQHYVGLNIATDIPLFNRNQGAIVAARSQVSYQQQIQRQKAIQISNEVSTSLQKVREVDRRVRSVEGRFTEQFDQLNQGVVISFRKGNISLLEFVDLIESYNQSIRELNRLKADRVGAYEELNYLIGEDLFK